MGGKAHHIFQDPDGECELLDSAPIVPYMDKQVKVHLDYLRSLLTQDDLRKCVDLRPYANRGCFTLPEDAALVRVYKLFRGMGLRHLPVVSRQGIPCGIITRKD